jgi:hypothetical protein
MRPGARYVSCCAGSRSLRVAELHDVLELLNRFDFVFFQVLDEDAPCRVLKDLQTRALLPEVFRL